MRLPFDEGLLPGRCPVSISAVRFILSVAMCFVVVVSVAIAVLTMLTTVYR